VSDDDETEVAEPTDYVPVAQALELSLFTITQLRALVSAGIVRTKRARVGGALTYCVEDLKRFDGAPRAEEPEQQSPLLQELRAITEGYKSMLDLALRQTKQAQDHERQLITSFSKPLENLGESSKALVGAVLDQNGQLVKRANDGDSARLEFVRAAETMLRDQRLELREQADLDRKHQLRQDMWDGVKKAGPALLDGLKQTMGVGDARIEAAGKLREKLSPDKVAALVAFNLLDSEELDLLCTAFNYDRADLERRAAEANEVKAEADAAEAAPEAAAPEAAE
jgi:hypothetical protein